MTNPHMQRAVQVGAASIDYWLCENDKAIELSSEIREMFREALNAAEPHIRAMIAQEIMDHISTEPTLMHNIEWRDAIETAARIAKGPQQ